MTESQQIKLIISILFQARDLKVVVEEEEVEVVVVLQVQAKETAAVVTIMITLEMAVAVVAVEVMQWGSAKGSKAQGGGALQALQHGALHGRRGGVQQLRPVGLRQSNYIP